MPTWLHEVLRRGLSVASHERFPSMDALLATLERGLARRRRVRAAVGGVLVACLGGTLVLGGALGRERPCDGLREAAMPAWTSAERRVVVEGIEASGLPESHRVREHVEARLDAYARAWTDARADACEATWVRREAGEQALARRMACLDERIAPMRAIVEQLAHAGPRAAAFAPSTVETLPSLAPCADVDALLRGPAPVPEALAADAAEIREHIARSWVAGTADDAGQGMDAAERAVAAAEPLTDAPVLRLEALRNRGHLRRTARRWAEARQDLELALELAERLDDDARAIDVLGDLVVLADEEGDASTARAWLTTLRGKLERLQPEAQRDALRWRLEAIVALRDHRLDQALSAATHAVGLQAGLEPPADVDHVEALLLLAEVRRQRGEHDTALAVLEQARTRAQDVGLLPLVANAHHRLGHAAYERGDLETARAELEAAMVVLRSFYPATSSASVRTLLLLALVLRLQGELDRAFEQASAAWAAIDERTSPALRGELANLLGSLHQSRGELDDALARYRDARATWSATPSVPRVELAMLDSNTADCLAAKGETAAALVLYDGALAVLSVDVPPDDPRRAYPLFGRGLALLEAQQRDAGIASLREALGLRDALARDPALATELRWALAQALRGDGHVPSKAFAHEAGALAREARGAFAGAGFTDRAAEIDAWLVQCGPACQPTPTNTASKPSNHLDEDHRP